MRVYVKNSRIYVSHEIIIDTRKKTWASRWFQEKNFFYTVDYT